MNEGHAARDQWRRLLREEADALSIYMEMPSGAPDVDGAQAATRAVSERLGAFEDEILASPIVSWPDIGLLAEIAFARMWPGHLLESDEASRVVADGPDCMERGEENAIGRLFLGIRQLSRESAATPPCSKTAGTSVKDAAAEIVALINVRPTSPRQDEIEAIVARTLAASEPSAFDAGPPILATWEARAALERWQRCLHDFLDRCKSGADTETDWAAIIQQSQIIWDRPVQSLDDVLLHAAVCIHWNSPGMATDPPYPDDIIADGPEGNMDNYATAMVMRGLLDLAGLQFDPEGRLLSVMRPEPWCKDECGPA